MAQEDKYVSLREFAAMRGVTVKAIIRRREAGAIPRECFKRQNGRTVIDAYAASDYMDGFR